MFDKRAKSIFVSFAVAVILGAGPVGCAGTPEAMSESARQFSMQKRAGDYTISAVDQSKLAYLDGIKLLNGAGPNADGATTFDVALEVQGLGVQFDKDRTYGYMRADRTFSNEKTVGIKFRFRF